MGRARGGHAVAGAQRRVRPTPAWEQQAYASTPVAVEGLPDSFELDGELWEARPDFHVSWYAGARFVDAVRAARGVDEESARGIVTRALAHARESHGLPRATRLTGEMRCATKNGRRSLIAMCETEGLEAFCSELSAQLGVEVPVPPAHVTLAAGPGMYGIGITSDEELRELSEPVGTTSSSVAPRLRSWPLAVAEADLLAARDEVNPDAAYESYCYDAAERVAEALTNAGQRAELCEAGAVRDPSHVYVVLADGTIVDPTLDQFYRGGRGNVSGDWNAGVWVERDRAAVDEELPSGNAWMGRLAVIPPDHPFAAHYLSHRADHTSDHYPDGYWVAGSEPAWWQALHSRD